MIRQDGFINGGDRYQFDFNICSFRNGWAQIDTNQDAWYFGQWCNPTTLEIFQYIEGDTVHQKAETEAEFCEALRDIKQFTSENGFQGIDPGLNEETEQRLIDLGLEDLFHPAPVEA